MNNFISLKQKLMTTWNNVENNKESINKLDKFTIIDKDTVYNKQKREIVLENNTYILGTSWVSSYQFNNLDDSQLQFLHPYILLSTSSAYANTDSWVFFTSYWWENYSINSSDVKILRTRVTGYILVVDDQGVSRSNVAPIYLTIKIKVLNNKLFEKITNSK